MKPAARRRAALCLASAFCGVAVLGSPASANADEVAYLVNVTVRPGIDFPNADAALDYGHRICDGVSRGSSYSDDIASVARDFDNDANQASYLVNQAVNELCPELIWQLRRSAAHYPPGLNTG